MRALEIIRAEHRNMWRVANALGALGQRLLDHPADLPDRTDLHTIELIVDYLEQFTERFHHPKEDEFLFARLLLRSNAAGDAIAALRHQHEMSPRQLVRIRELASSSAPSLDATRRLGDEILSFRDRLGEHMRLEEEGTFELARETLTGEDWREIDAAFEGHIDPLETQGDSGIDGLRQRITRLLPEPEGLGGHVDAPVTPRAAGRPVIGECLLRIDDLRTRYGRIEALHGVSMEVREGQLIALVGANGAGKTTLLRCISGVQPLSGGAIFLRGDDLARRPSDARVRAGICQAPEGRQVFGPMSIEDNLRMGAYTRPAREIAASLEETYALFPVLREKRNLPAGTLSGGQQQMLALGRALMGKPKLLLLDEPSMGLAPLIVEEIFRVVRALKESGMTILLVEQNARAALSIADFAYVLETGRVTLQGPGRELLANDDVRRAYLGM